MKWMGQVPRECDLCDVPLVDFWIDGRTMFGSWANMCIPCHEHMGMGLGTGKGQKYDLKTQEKVEG